jgi:hypothetical protein
MRPTSHSKRHCLLVLVLLETVALTATAMAEPMAPSRVRTITVHPQSAEDHGEPSASPANSFKIPTTKVRPQLSGESRDGSGRQLAGEQTIGNAVPSVDPHKVRTFSVRPDPSATSDSYRHLVPTTPVPAQSIPQ